MTRGGGGGGGGGVRVQRGEKLFLAHFLLEVHLWLSGEIVGIARTGSGSGSAV